MIAIENCKWPTLVHAEKDHSAEFTIYPRQLLSEGGHLRQEPFVKSALVGA
jgi:hypothetical protein